MKGHWTNEQWEAITDHSGNILVAAAAGSGKTAVLVERIINLITNEENPVDIDKLLVLTFTKAAASEMSERIREAIEEKLNKNPYNEHLQKQLVYINRADIRTIDSFCLKVVKENYNELGIEPNLKTMDSAQEILLKSEAIEELFEDMYSIEDNDEFFSLVEIYGEDTKDTRLKELILEIYKFIQSNPFPDKWLDESAELFNLDEVDIDNTIWGKIVSEKLKNEIYEILSISNRLAKTVKSYGIFEVYMPALYSDIKCLEEFYNASKKGFISAFNHSQISFKRFGQYKGEEKDLKENICDIRNKKVKDAYKSIIKKYFSYPPEKMIENINNMYPIIKSICKLVKLFSEKYYIKKEEKMTFDFSDYEHFCLNVLLEKGSNIQNIIPSKIALQLQQKYQEILVDEYQDTNLIQELILRAVSKESLGQNNLFMVGDVKQSIYRFRQARPQLFLEKHSKFPREKGNKSRLITLSKNFRSRENILDSANFIFSQIMTEKFGEINYDRNEALYKGAEFPEFDGDGIFGGDTEIHIIDTTSKNIEADEEDLTGIELEAHYIAHRINELIKSGFNVFDKKTKEYRKAEFKDFVVLLRKKEEWGDIFLKIFSENLIPSYAETSNGYFNTKEILFIINILKIMDNPIQDIPLISVLHSPVYNFTNDELLEIRLSDKKIDSFYMSCKNYIEKNLENNISKRLISFFETLEKWRDEAVYTPISQMIWQIYNETGYYDYIGVINGGKIRQANLRMLVDKAALYEESNLKGLFNFVRYIEKMKKNEAESGEAKLLSESENLVRIMTVHKSKGLEFPIVFVAGIGKKFNESYLKQKLLIHQDLGFGGDYIDFENRIIYPTITKTAVSSKLSDEMLAEELRILYVAMTRAKEKLILTGNIKNIYSNLLNWYEVAINSGDTINSESLLNAHNYLDWIIPAILRHKDANGLLNQIGSKFEPIEYVNQFSKSKWNINIHSESEIITNRDIHEIKSDFDIKFDLWDTSKDYSGYKSEIYKKLLWNYKHEIAVNLPSNITISEIKRQKYKDNEQLEFEANWVNEEEIFEFPDFVKKTKVSSASRRGTVIHNLMQRLDFSRDYDKDYINSEVDKLILDGIITKDERNIINIKDIKIFYNSDLKKRMSKANKLYKETPFTIAVKPCDVFSDDLYKNINEDIILHGIIDNYFYEGDEIVLIDYKSDRIKQEEEYKLKNRYNIQLNLYKYALEKITKNKVKECYIYSFALGKNIKIE